MEVIYSFPTCVQFTFELLGCYGAVLIISSSIDSYFYLHLNIQVFCIRTHCKFMSCWFFTFQSPLYKQSHYSVVPTSRTSAGRGALHTSYRCLELWLHPWGTVHAPICVVCQRYPKAVLLMLSLSYRPEWKSSFNFFFLYSWNFFTFQDSDKDCCYYSFHIYPFVS